jgi:hypothetical protein
MPVLETLENTADTTVEEFLAEVTTAAPDLATSWDNRPTWDNWSKR